MPKIACANAPLLLLLLLVSLKFWAAEPTRTLSQGGKGVSLLNIDVGASSSSAAARRPARMKISAAFDGQRSSLLTLIFFLPLSPNTTTLSTLLMPPPPQGGGGACSRRRALLCAVGQRRRAGAARRLAVVARISKFERERQSSASVLHACVVRARSEKQEMRAHLSHTNLVC